MALFGTWSYKDDVLPRKFSLPIGLVSSVLSWAWAAVDELLASCYLTAKFLPGADDDHLFVHASLNHNQLTNARNFAVNGYCCTGQHERVFLNGLLDLMKQE